MFSPRWTKLLRDLAAARGVLMVPAIGAVPRQIAAMYLTWILIVSVAAVAWAMPLSAWAGKGFATAVTNLHTINLSVDGHPATWRVVGIVKEIGPATAYVTEDSFEERVSRRAGPLASAVAHRRDNPGEHVAS